MTGVQTCALPISESQPSKLPWKRIAFVITGLFGMMALVTLVFYLTFHQTAPGPIQPEAQIKPLPALAPRRDSGGFSEIPKDPPAAMLSSKPPPQAPVTIRRTAPQPVEAAPDYPVVSKEQCRENPMLCTK